MTLPTDWTQMHTGAVVEALWAQAASHSLRTSMARLLIWAHFDLLSAKLSKKRMKIEEVPPLHWRVNDLRLRYLPTVDDSLVDGTVTAGMGPMHQLIVPVGQGAIARAALASTIPKAGLRISAIDELISFRQQMTILDTGWSGQRVSWYLLRQYNWRARRLRTARRLIVPLPPAYQLADKGSVT